MSLPPHLLNLQANLNNLLKTSPQGNDKNNLMQIIESKVTEIKQQSKHKDIKQSKNKKIVEGKSKKIKNPRLSKKRWKVLRKSAGEVWEDPTLEEWPENDYRIFCGDLGNEVSEDILANAFRKYSSFLKARIIRDKRNNKSRGYGFISFGDVNDYIKVMREMNGKYVGNRPIRLKRSTWKDRSLFNSKSKLENVKFKRNKVKIRTKDFMNPNLNANFNQNISEGMNQYGFQNYTVNNNNNNLNMMNYDMMNPLNSQANNINMMQYGMQGYSGYIQPNPYMNTNNYG